MPAIKRRNRRKGPDTLVKTIQFITVFSWLIIFVIIIVFSLAKPRFQGFGRNFTVVSGAAWNTKFLEAIPFILVVQLIICVLGIVINARRMKRKTDKLSMSLVVFSIVSVIGLIIYFLIK